jgi:hypothetical protein
LPLISRSALASLQHAFDLRKIQGSAALHPGLRSVATSWQGSILLLLIFLIFVIFVCFCANPFCPSDVVRRRRFDNRVLARDWSIPDTACPFGAEALRLRRGLHLLDQRGDQLSCRKRSREWRTLARPLRAIAGLTLCLGRGVEGLACVIGHRISGNLTSGHV